MCELYRRLITPPNYVWVAPMYTTVMVARRNPNGVVNQLWTKLGAGVANCLG